MTYATALDPDHPHKFNHRRLYEYCGDIPPAELEATYYAQQRAQPLAEPSRQ
jgi:putative transposase